jgi:hypothetical protein
VVDLEAGSARTVANLPAPIERYSVWSAGLTSDGAVLASTETGDQLQLKRSADGQAWADVGEPMSKGMDFGLGRWLLAREKGGTVMTLSMSTGYGHYVNELQLTSAAGTHRLGTGGVYVNGSLDPGAADLSADGQCAAAWVQRGEMNQSPLDLVLFDVTGKQQVVRTETQPGWMQFL